MKSIDAVRGLVVLVVAGLAIAGAAAGCRSPADAAPVDATPVGEAGAGDGGAFEASISTTFTEAAMRAAADAFNAKYCPALAMCDPLFLAYDYGTLEECLGVGANIAVPAQDGTFIRYANELTAPYAYGSLLTPDVAIACAKALDFSTCDAFQAFGEGHIPDVCHPINYGFLPDGSSCREWNQCASGRCDVHGSAGSCGRCVTPFPIGASCGGFADPKCAYGSECRGSKPRCGELHDVGGSCGDGQPCHRTLVCVAGTCAKPPADGSCDPAVGCALSPFFQYCNETTRRCEPVPLAKLGEPCGFTAEYPKYKRAINCERNGSCTAVRGATIADSGADDAGPARPPYVCTPLVADGEPCSASDAFGSPCERPDSLCYQNRCQQNGPAECSPPPRTP